MGMGQSSAAVLNDHQLLFSKLVGQNFVDIEDPFWDALLNIDIPLTKIDPTQVEDFVYNSCPAMVGNTRETQHFTKLVIRSLDVLQVSNDFTDDSF